MGRRNLSSSSTHSLYESKISLEVMSILFLLAFRCTYFSISKIPSSKHVFYAKLKMQYMIYV